MKQLEYFEITKEEVRYGERDCYLEACMARDRHIKEGISCRVYACMNHEDEIVGWGVLTEQKL